MHSVVCPCWFRDPPLTSLTNTILTHITHPSFFPFVSASSSLLHPLNLRWNSSESRQEGATRPHTLHALPAGEDGGAQRTHLHRQRERHTHSQHSYTHTHTQSTSEEPRREERRGCRRRWERHTDTEECGGASCAEGQRSDTHTRTLSIYLSLSLLLSFLRCISLVSLCSLPVLPSASHPQHSLLPPLHLSPPPLSASTHTPHSRHSQTPLTLPSLTHSLHIRSMHLWNTLPQTSYSTALCICSAVNLYPHSRSVRMDTGYFRPLTQSIISSLLFALTRDTSASQQSISSPRNTSWTS